MNILVVGYAGFIGRSLIKEILRSVPGAKLYLFGRTDSLPHGMNISAECVMSFKDALCHRQDIFHKAEVVYYLKSATIPASSWDHPHREWEENASLFLKFMELLSPEYLKKMIFISSAGTVYGTVNHPVREDEVCRPFSPYGIMKLCMEHFMEYYRRKKGIPYEIYRITNVYGPGQDTSKGLGVINTMIEKIIQERKITIFGNGEVYRNFIYIKDVVTYLKEALFKSPVFGPVNMAHDHAYSINQVVEHIMEIAPPFEVEYLPHRKSDNPYSHADNTLLKKIFPHVRQKELKDGISETFKAIYDNWPER